MRNSMCSGFCNLNFAVSVLILRFFHKLWLLKILEAIIWPLHTCTHMQKVFLIEQYLWCHLNGLHLDFLGERQRMILISCHSQLLSLSTARDKLWDHSCDCFSFSTRGLFYWSSKEQIQFLWLQELLTKSCVTVYVYYRFCALHEWERKDKPHIVSSQPCTEASVHGEKRCTGCNNGEPAVVLAYSYSRGRCQGAHEGESHTTK